MLLGVMLVSLQLFSHLIKQLFKVNIKTRDMGLSEFKYHGIQAKVYSFQKHVFFPISGHTIYLGTVHQSE